METTHLNLSKVHALTTSTGERSGTMTSSYETARSHLSLSETQHSHQTAGSAPPFCGSSSITHSTDVANASEIGEDEIVIAIMGPTGAGKSTFVKIATGLEDIEIGHTLRSSTQHIRAIRCHNPLRNQHFVFVDTPGFDDGTRSDTKILTEVADWLKKTYQAGVKLSGILYLHRITDNRMTNTLVRNLDMFQNLCGNGALSNVRFVTTHWDQLKDNNQGIQTEGELRKRYFYTFLCGGSEMHRFQYSCSSAWQIINSLPMERKAIRIQKEMVDQHKSLWETSAARSLLSWVHRAVEALKNFIRHLEELIQKVTSTDSSEIKGRGMDSEHRKYEKELKAARKLLKTLESDKSQFYKRHPAIDSDHPSGSPSADPSSLASTLRDVSYKISDRSERTIRRPHTSDLSTCSEPTVADSLECEPDVAYGPPGPSPTLGSLSHTIQRLRTARATAAQVVLPSFEDAVEIALRISEILGETPNAHHSLSSLVESTSCFLLVIKDKYSPTKGYPNFITEAFESIHRQLVSVQDVATRLKDCKTEPQMSFALSLDDQRAIAECHKAVASTLRDFKSENLNPEKNSVAVSPTTQTPNISPPAGGNHQGCESLHASPRSTEGLPKLIAVMGPTGVGKSMFIKAATRSDNGSRPSVMDKIVLVETPGLDDAFGGDVQILKEIAEWLRNTCPAGVKLFGILFLHSITDKRVTNTMLQNLDLFQDLCNSAVLSSVILVTTNWDQLHAENIFEGDVHEQQLREKYWRPLLKHGSKMQRFKNTCSSAWDIINSFPNNLDAKGDEKETW